MAILLANDSLGPMKTISALSFWQPYAWLIVNGHADIDSRTWAPIAKRIGSRIAVHAAKRKMSLADYEEFLKMVKDQKIKDYPKSRDDFPYGMIVGTVVLADVTKTSKSYWAAPGFYHWLLKLPRKIKPQPVKGQRGWFQYDIDK